MKNRRIHRAVLTASASAAALLTFAAPGYAMAQSATYSFDIPSQDISAALVAYGQAARQQLVFDGKAVRQRQSAALVGEYSAEAGLEQLLSGTGLKAQFVGSGAVRIVDASAPQGSSAAGGGAEVEALIVTAQKREEDIQDVPIAISAFSQEDLTRSQIAGGPDLITQVPNMTFTKTNFSSYSIQLRGIGTQAISATTDPAVAVAFNNTPFIRNRFFEQEFYDLQRVEVLRGPQGTLYGRNATAGVVNIISAKPKFIAEAKLSGDLGNFSSSRIEGMVNIPLVEDKVALRLAGAWTKRDGYSSNELKGEQIDGRDLWSTRLSLRVQPTDRLDVNLIWEHFEEDDDRLRSGKQLCNKDVVHSVGSVDIPNYLDTRVSGGQSGSLWAGVQATFSQGCERNSLYAKDSFQRPNGIMLPYYVPLRAVGLPTALIDPYVSDIEIDFTVPGYGNGFIDVNEVDALNDQPEDLRVIQSTVDPIYRAESDLGELQISFDLTDTLTLSSETAYANDFVYSLQDFNRFNTAPGAFLQQDTQGTIVDRPDLLLPGESGGIFCDPQLGCSDRLVAVDISTATASQFSQEFRLGSDFDGPFNFSLGANYLRADSEDKYYVFFNSISLFMAKRPFYDDPATAAQFPWVPGFSDNSECLRNGYLPGNPDFAYPVVGCGYIDPNPIESVNDEGHNYFLSKNPYKLISYAVFGEAYYNITDALKVTAGLRWTVDKKEAPRVPSWIAATQTVGYPVAEVIEQEWREPTGRLTVDWKPDLAFTDDTMVYASYAHGYKAGGANPPGFVRAFYSDRSVALDQAAESATRPKTFDPEFVDAFELGSKNVFADGTVTMNMAAFYYDYKDYQISEIVDRSAFNRNFDATVWGLELEADWRPLENLKLGFKGGYEKTRIGDHEQAIDLMDRTAGDPDWILVRPFPTYASSCIVPTFVYENPNGTLGRVGGVGGGGPGACELAYTMGFDPVTAAPYVPNPQPPGGNLNQIAGHPGYPGWDPLTAPNGGEGIMKPLGGNELPNAPQWTGTITADYTVPLPNDWLATLHTDLHWQAESWWRVFQDHEFSRLDEYFTMNLAAIFVNEERGWNVMAYIKNVTDETAITGAFLNSDDTGLTTNVFLTEPRLYGLRVTKAWTGGPLLGSFGARQEGPYPLTVEFGGQVQRHDAPNTTLQPAAADEFDGPLDIFDDTQAQDLDWGDGRDVKVTWRPSSGPWSVSGAVRFGKTNHGGRGAAEELTDPVCAVSDPDYCAYLAGHEQYYVLTDISAIQRADAKAFDREEHNILDFKVGYDMSFGGLNDSVVSAGLRYAELTSDTEASLYGVPHWIVPAAFYETGEDLHRTIYVIDVDAQRSFEGWGPIASWDASLPLFGSDENGRVRLDWSLEGGVLFGDQQSSSLATTRVNEHEIDSNAYVNELLGAPVVHEFQPYTTLATVNPAPRSEDATVPMAAGSLGLSYKVGGFKVGAGYRWERYFDVIDGGYEEHRSEDRTIDGPYFKIAVGFGG
jgi:outer membrane receptor protein involved in Fe transport